MSKLKFPTHLRKMWSGSEVQAWIDEQLAEQAEQEPVAWVTAKESFCGFPKLVFSETQKDGYKPLYAAPVRTKDLTDDEIVELWRECEGMSVEDYARAVIAVYREKNNANNNT